MDVSRQVDVWQRFCAQRGVDMFGDLISVSAARMWRRIAERWQMWTDNSGGVMGIKTRHVAPHYAPAAYLVK